MPMLSDELASLDARAQAELVRMKEVKPIELVEAALFRLAAQLAKARHWAGRRPSVSA
jgi:hypothetical protein